MRETAELGCRNVQLQNRSALRQRIRPMMCGVNFKSNPTKTAQNGECSHQWIAAGGRSAGRRRSAPAACSPALLSKQPALPCSQSQILNSCYCLGPSQQLNNDDSSHMLRARRHSAARSNFISFASLAASHSHGFTKPTFSNFLDHVQPKVSPIEAISKKLVVTVAFASLNHCCQLLSQMVARRGENIHLICPYAGVLRDPERPERLLHHT